MARVRLAARLLPRAGARPGRGARLGARARARDGGRGRPARYRRRAPARGAGQALAHAGRAGRPGPGARASTRTRCCAALGYGDDEIAALEEAGAVAGAAEAGARGSFMAVSAERAPEDEGAGRAQRRQRRHDQALPARGPAARAGQDLAQHGLLPARVRRADPADQAAPGGALHAAQADPLGARRRPRARAGAGRARGPHPRARARRATAAASRPRSCGAATTSRRRCSTGWRELEILTPDSRGYGARDVQIVEAISRFRAGGYDERIGFTVYDTLRYKRALEELVKEEVAGADGPAGRRARARAGRRADRRPAPSRSAT